MARPTWSAKPRSPVCTHLNEHVESLAFPHRWTPSPDQVLLPVAARAFTEPQPKPPKASISSDPRVKAAADPQAFNDYLDARAAWLARRFAWDAAQKSIHQLKDKAGSGDLDGMREYLMKVLHDVLWPLPTTISYEFNGQEEVRLEFIVPGLDAIPDREAAMASGNRVEIRRMSDISHTKLHNQHALGLVVRLLGELFAALPTIDTVTVSARCSCRPTANRSATSCPHKPIASNGRRCIRTARSPRTRRFAAWVSWGALQSDGARRLHGGRAIRLIALRAIVPMPVF